MTGFKFPFARDRDSWTRQMSANTTWHIWAGARTLSWASPVPSATTASSVLQLVTHLCTPRVASLSSLPRLPCTSERAFCDPSKSFHLSGPWLLYRTIARPIFKVVFVNSSFTYLYTNCTHMHNSNVLAFSKQTFSLLFPYSCSSSTSPPQNSDWWTYVGLHFHICTLSGFYSSLTE